MPDHLHGLVWWPRTHRTSVSEVVGGFKEDASRAIRSRRLIDATQRLWQRSFIAREVRSASSFETTAEYIRRNPETALVKQGGWSSSRSPEGDR
jgi:REP element-mobilizing transposase RayT